RRLSPSHDLRAGIDLAPDEAEPDAAVVERQSRANRAHPPPPRRDPGVGERGGGPPNQPAEVPVGVAAEMEPRHRLLAHVASLGVRDPAYLVVPHLLRQGPLVDLRTEG